MMTDDGFCGAATFKSGVAFPTPMLGHIREHDITVYLTAADAERLAKQVVSGSALKRIPRSSRYDVVDINARINEMAADGGVSLRENRYAPRIFFSPNAYGKLMVDGSFEHTPHDGYQLAFHIVELMGDPDLSVHYSEIGRVIDEMRRHRPATGGPARPII